MHPATAVILLLLGPTASATSQTSTMPASLQARIEKAGSAELRWSNWSGYRVQVTDFYQRLGGQRAWVRGPVPTPQAWEVMAKLAAADLKGLNAVDYDGDRWQARTAALSNVGEAGLEAFDVALTVCVMRYISDLSVGRIDPAKLGQGFGRTSHQLVLPEFVAGLTSAPDPGARLEGIEPRLLPYRTLLAQLPRYLELSRRPAQKLPPVRLLSPGDLYPGAAALAELLVALGDLTPDAAKALSPGRYDPALAAAVKLYQVRHGLDDNGKLGPRTLAQLNRPLSQRLNQIRLTLERWRWASQDLGPRVIEVNLPAYNLSALSKKGEDYQTDLWMRVVVGDAYKHETPVLSSKVATVVFRPYWNVPRSIVKSDILPALRRHPSYLAQHGYEIVAWYEDPKGAQPPTARAIRALTAGRFQLRQKPGPENALGRVKLLFPNTHEIYLHDTPARAALGRPQRDLSHGCVRVERAAELAAWVLRDDPAWPEEKVKAAMAEDGPPLVVQTPAQVQVLFVYGTATVDGSGHLYFYEDVYGNDESLQKALSTRY